MSKQQSLEQVRQKCLKAFQLLRRLEEADENGYCTCISTGKREEYQKLDGGHYISRRCRATELEHDNVWPQSKYANQYLGGDTLNYRDSLIRKIGLERVERLENLHRAWQGSDVEIAEEDKPLLEKKTRIYYNEKLKEINRKIKEEKTARRI
jgi:hypothetical protein